jgi:CRISPR-associated protein Csy1
MVHNFKEGGGMENDFSKLIARYIDDRKMMKIEQFEKDAEKKRKGVKDPEELPELEAVLADERKNLENKFLPENWLTDAARRAKQRQLVTHAIKFIHPDAKGNSFYAPGGPENSEMKEADHFISTASLKSPEIDSVGNAAALDVSSFLQLSLEGKTLVEFIRQSDVTPLKPFASDTSQLDEWMSGFREVLSAGQPVSHTLSKQIYFPVDGHQYHLLSPLYPSSLVHAVYSRITEHRFSETAKEARKAKREGRFCKEMAVDFPDTLRQSFGGTKPQNISQLNSQRNGKSILLSCAPPSWKKQRKPPFKTKTIFSKYHFGFRVWREILDLRRFLDQQVSQGSNMRIRRKREEMIDKIMDHFIQYGAEIQSLHEYAGWSGKDECHLNSAQKLWLDPFRGKTDELFRQERENNDWQADVSDQFAFWLNKEIDKSSRLTPGDREHLEWQGLVESKLKMFKQDFEEYA